VPKASEKHNRGKKIAITGKGGSGKTAITAIMLKLLLERKALRILAIDADSSIGLSYALGMEADKTVGELRRKMIEEPGIKADLKNRHIRDVMAENLKQGDGFHLLVMGRPEGPGCYCSVNELLKYGIESLSKEYDITLIDCEAGPEQVNRRVVEGMDILIAITDATMRGVRVACAIKEVAQSGQGIRSTRIGLVINKAKDDCQALADIALRQCNLDVLGTIPEDQNITRYDLADKPLIELPNNSPSVIAVRDILEKLDI
jgi:CO dehydrogenase maturation factor